MAFVRPIAAVRCGIAPKCWNDASHVVVWGGDVLQHYCAGCAGAVAARLAEMCPPRHDLDRPRVRRVVTFPCGVEACREIATHQTVCGFNMLAIGEFCRPHAGMKRRALEAWERGEGAIHHGIVAAPLLGMIEGDAAERSPSPAVPPLHLIRGDVPRKGKTS